MKYIVALAVLLMVAGAQAQVRVKENIKVSAVSTVETVKKVSPIRSK